MAIALRRPYADELLGTLIVEYLADEKVAHRKRFLRSLLGCQVTSLVAMPGGLQRLSDQTFDYWNMTATEIAQKFTLMPYYVASSSPRISLNVLTAMTQYSGRIRNRSGLGFGRYSTPETLRYCRQCVRSDMENGHKPYFRRVHQLPGVAVCAKHMTLLINSDLRVSTLHVDGASRLANAFNDGATIALDLMEPSRMEAIVGVTRKSEEVLMHAAPSDFFNMRVRYRHCLEERGYTYRSGNCRLDELSANIVEHFGESYLRWLGLFRTGQEARDWLVPLICQGQAAAPTIAHVLLQQFFNSTNVNKCRLSGKFIIECPCNALERDAGAFRGDIEWQGDTHGNAKCICGTRFGFHLHGQVSMVDRIWRYGKCYRDYAVRQKEKGRCVQEIAVELGVSTMTVRRFCRSAPSESSHQPPSRTASEVLRCRQEWLKAVESCGSLTLARRMARKTYRALLRYDRKWLDGRCTNVASSFLQRVDWSFRDSTYVTILRESAEAIRSENPPRWVSAISILMVSNVPRGTRNQLEKLPKCRALLKEVVETRRQFRERTKRANTVEVRPNDAALSSRMINAGEQ
ncbi:TnsD family Tn7-like transposition protein [Burkholderia ubonensis]|uniref:TnsD family Tn7-like transposition protein n=1 Tax=Burkholderia ubonensis TaxID=101571 RepID=UPI000A7CBEDC|nr:TnsD family Tn7-like transposition protein [Burkholderia ubonensis]